MLEKIYMIITKNLAKKIKKINCAEEIDIKLKIMKMLF